MEIRIYRVERVTKDKGDEMDNTTTKRAEELALEYHEKDDADTRSIKFGVEMAKAETYLRKQRTDMGNHIRMAMCVLSRELFGLSRAEALALVTFVFDSNGVEASIVRSYKQAETLLERFSVFQATLLTLKMAWETDGVPTELLKECKEFFSKRGERE